jgi:hypothetical protein
MADKAVAAGESFARTGSKYGKAAMGCGKRHAIGEQAAPCIVNTLTIATVLSRTAVQLRENTQ